VHHKYTNIPRDGRRRRLRALLRVTRDQRWKRFSNHLQTCLFNTCSRLASNGGVGLQHVEIGKIVKKRMDQDELRQRTEEFFAKAGRQILKDYVAFPGADFAVTRRDLHVHAEGNCRGQRDPQTCGANRPSSSAATFPDGAEKFTKTDMIGRNKRASGTCARWLGSANFRGADGLLRFMSGNLCHQIRAPPVTRICPANRLHEISVRVACGVRQVRPCPTTTGSFLMQYGKTLAHDRQAVVGPDKYLLDNADPNAPETRSERMFARIGARFRRVPTPVTGPAFPAIRPPDLPKIRPSSRPPFLGLASQQEGGKRRSATRRDGLAA